MLYQGFVIKKTDIGEYDQIVTLYTKEFGKVTGIAKSVKKNSSKQAGHLDVFNLVDFIFVTGKNYPIITNAQSVETFSGIKSDLAKNVIGFFILEMVENLVYDHDRDAVFWNFLIEKLEELEKIGNSNGSLKKFFLDLKGGFVDILGYGGNLNEKDARNFLISLSQRNPYSLLLIDAVIK